MVQRLILNRWEIFFFLPSLPHPPPGDLVCCPCWIYEVRGTKGNLPIMPFEGAQVPSSCHWPSRMSQAVSTASVGSHCQPGRTVYKASYLRGAQAANKHCSPGLENILSGVGASRKREHLPSARGWATSLLGDSQQLSGPLCTPALLLKERKRDFSSRLP